MAAETIVRVIAVICLIVFVKSAPSNVPQASHVPVTLLDFSYTGQCDPFGISECDLKFLVDYSWIGKFGLTWTRTVNYGEYDTGSSAHVDFGKEAPHIFSGSPPAGSKVVVNVEAKDDDLIGNDDLLGRFRFEYTIPPTPQPHSVLSMQDGKATMTIDFETFF